jgi:hypothetical protein
VTWWRKKPKVDVDALLVELERTKKERQEFKTLAKSWEQKTHAAEEQVVKLQQLSMEDDLMQAVEAQADPESVVKLTKKQQAKHDSGSLIRVRDSEDADGDLIFHLHLETYDRRLLDALAKDYNLHLVFPSEYNDYEREEFGMVTA